MSETIVFFGSGPVAAASLRHLLKCFDVEAVITKPPTLEEMKTIANGITVHSAKDRKELDELINTGHFKSRIGVVVDFGIIVSGQVIDYFELGIVNSHFSLLPRWRGADPISFAILAGDQKTGVSLMLIEPELDTGAVLVQKSLAISTDDTTPTLTQRLIKLSNQLLEEYLPRYVSGEVKPRQQPHPERATYSRKLTKEDGLIDWAKPAVQLEREIRAYLGWPNSRTTLGDKEVIVTKARVIDESGKPGEIAIRGKGLVVYTGDKALLIESLKPAGKNEMTAAAFLAGYGHLFTN